MNVNHKVQDFPSMILGKMEYVSNLSTKMESESDFRGSPREGHNAVPLAWALN